MKLIDLLVKELPKSGGWPSEAVTAIYFSHKKGVTFYDKDGMGIKNGVSFICMDIHGVRREEVTKEEFESALAKNDGWIEWGGGECPLDDDTIVEVRFRNEELGRGVARADSYMWCHGLDDGNIIAYRLHRDINPRANDDRLEQDLNECIGQDVDMPEWNGEGLPTVGAEFEHSSNADGFSTWHWRKCTAVGNRGVLCVDEENTELYLNYTNNRFRPLRSEADKKRDAAISAIDVACLLVRNASKTAEAIYDAIAEGKIPGVKLEGK